MGLNSSGDRALSCWELVRGGWKLVISDVRSRN